MKHLGPLLLLMGLLAKGACAQSPSAAVSVAAADVKRQARSEQQQRVRYLSLYHVSDRKELDQWDALLRFWVNSLSREAEIVAPFRVAANLWRVDLADYQWDAKVWERLAEVEPYFTVRVVTVLEAKPARTVREYWNGGVNPADGKHYAPGWYDMAYPAVEGKKKITAAFGEWLPANEALALGTATNSQVPIVRADWWFYQTAIADGRKAGYYDWLGLGKKEADWLALIGADVDKARKIRREIGALVSRSTVTLNNRALERFDAISGPYWRSRDFDRNTDVKNALRLLDGDIKEDASEQYGSLPNRLWAFWLQNAKGERQDTAPPNIASDGKSRGTDRQVHAGLSCVRCHEEGIRPIRDWARKVYQPPFQLEDRIYEETKRLRSKYLSDLQEQVEEDQQRYTKALKKVNGLTPAANAKLIADLWDWYAERDRTLSDFAAELGTDEKTLGAALKEEAKRTQLDPVLAGLLQGVEIRPEHAEEVYALAQQILGRKR